MASIIITKFHQLFTKVITPSPKLNLSQEESWIISQRITLFLWQAFLLLCFKIFVGYFPRIAEIIEVNYRIVLTFALLMIGFCRTHPNLLKFVLAFHYSVTYSYLATTSPAKVFNFFGFNITILFICMIYSESFLWVLLGIGVQVYTINTAIKNNLIKYLQTSSPEEFVEDFVQKNSYFIIVSGIYILTYFFFVKKLRNRVFQSKKDADSAFTQLKQFIQSFSHEIRNPLNSLIGNIDLASNDENISAFVSDRLKVAKVCSELLLQLINNILDSGKAEIGMLDIDPRPINILNQLSKVWFVTSEVIRKKGINAVVMVQKKFPSIIKIDGTRICQIMMNLLGNATKFTQKGQIKMEVSWINKSQVDDSCFETPPEFQTDFSRESISNSNYCILNRQIGKSYHSDYNYLTFEKKNFEKDEFQFNDKIGSENEECKGILKIEVKDTGVGITADDQKQLFRRFSQVGQNSNAHEGSGLGLFITKELIDKMNGQVKLYSQKDKGTSIIVCIPSYYKQNYQTILNLNSLQDKVSELNLKCLIAEPTLYNISLIKEFLQKIPVNVVSTSFNGQSAYSFFKEKNEITAPDFIIADNDMPLMDGVQLVKKIRKYEHDTNSAFPVKIILLCRAEKYCQIKSDLEKNSKSSVDIILKKPICFDYLLEAIKEIYNLN